LVEKPGRAVVNIVPEGSGVKKLPDDAISSRFIVESVAQGKLLQPRDFLVKPQERGPGPNVEEAKAERMRFTVEDDKALKKWVASNPGLPSQGQKLWERAERAKVTKHTWQSMQNRWRRRLQGKKEPAHANKNNRLPGKPARQVAAEAIRELEEEIEDPDAPTQPAAPKKTPKADASVRSKGASASQVAKLFGKRKAKDGASEAPRKKREAPQASESQEVVEVETKAKEAREAGGRETRLAAKYRGWKDDDLWGVPKWLRKLQDLSRPADLSGL